MVLETIGRRLNLIINRDKPFFKKQDTIQMIFAPLKIILYLSPRKLFTNFLI
jgi:hypothetical protein